MNGCKLCSNEVDVPLEFPLLLVILVESPHAQIYCIFVILQSPVRDIATIGMTIIIIAIFVIVDIVDIFGRVGMIELLADL